MFMFQYYIQMNKIEEIVRDRIVIELESLKRELREEIKRLESESEFTDDTSYSIFLENQVEGIELAIDRINRRIQEKKQCHKIPDFHFSFFLYIFLSFFYYISY